MDAPQTRSCERNRAAESPKLPRGARQICIPLTRDRYHDIWGDPGAVRDCLDCLIGEHPEMFPPSISDGYQLPDVRLRQIRMADGVFTLRPSFVFFDMTGTVDDVERRRDFWR